MGSSFENSREILTNHSKWQETPFLHGEKKKKKKKKKIGGAKTKGDVPLDKRDGGPFFYLAE